jgi:hypothetical protein
MIPEYYNDPENFNSLSNIDYERGYKEAIESFKGNKNDNYIMTFFKYRLPLVYKEIKDNWIGKGAILAGDNIYFTCSLKKLAKIFKDNGGCAGIGQVIDNMFINIYYTENYQSVNYNSFKSTYSNL